MQIEHTVTYSGNFYSCEIYHKYFKNADGIMISIKYWGIYKGNIFALGSGGYIPEFHPEKERIFEFRFKTYTFLLE